MSSVSQQVLALDARYNAYRTPNYPGFRTLYIRRRSQLLRENAKNTTDSQIRKNYLRTRSQLLAQRYGVVASEGSVKSRSLSMSVDLSRSQQTLGELESGDPSRKGSRIVPTAAADASRALVGNTSLSENYSFAGVHHIFDQHTRSISRLAFAHDEKYRLAIASLDGTLSICEVSDEPSLSRLVVKLVAHTNAVTDFAWSISNDVIVSCSLDSTVRVWDANSGECIRSVDDNNTPILCCAFQPLNNNLVVTGNAKGLVQVLNISTGKYIKTGASKTTGAALCMCCENSGKLIWVGDDKGYVSSFIADMTSGKLIKGRRIVVCVDRSVTSLSFKAWVSRESRDPFLLANTTANVLCLYKVVGSDGNLHLYRRFPLNQSHMHVRSCFCPLMSFREGACILSGSEDSVVYLFDIERDQRHCINNLLGHANAVLDVTFNHDESLLASGDLKGVVIVWKRIRNGADSEEKKF